MYLLSREGGEGDAYLLMSFLLCLSSLARTDIQVESYHNEIYKLTDANRELKLARDEALYKVSLKGSEGGKESRAVVV